MGTVLDFFEFFWNAFVIVTLVLCVFNKKVRDSYIGFVSVVVETMIQIHHIHIYRDKDGWMPKNWGGIHCFQRTRQCRCGATKIRIQGTSRGELP